VEVPQKDHPETVEAQAAKARVRQTKNQHNHRPTTVVEVMAVVVAEAILVVIKTTKVTSPSRISAIQVMVITGAENQRTRRKTSNVLQCQTPYASERGGIVF